MKIGIVTLTDGRARIAKAGEKNCRAAQERLAGYLKRKRHDVIAGRKIVWNYETARREAQRVALAYPDVVILNLHTWTFPGLAAQVASLIPEVPLLVFGALATDQPACPAFFACVGALDEIGLSVGRVLGDVRKPDTQRQIDRFLQQQEPDERVRGERAAAMLRGQRYGQFDGPSMGLYTGHLDPAQWMEQLGVHVFHRGQLHLWQLAQKVNAERVAAGVEWLEKHTHTIHYDARQLTPGVHGTLARQVRLYLALKDLCKLEGIDFCGLSGQLDLTEWADLCLPDVAEALLNDTADWEDTSKKPLICASAGDANGALTMQLMHHLTGTPVLCAELRHYRATDGLYHLVGQRAPWYARRSKDYRRNWKACQLYPALEPVYRAGGAHLQFPVAAASRVTFARVARRTGRFVMHIFTGSIPKLAEQKQARLAKHIPVPWAHVFAQIEPDFATVQAHYNSQYVHAVVGDHVAALQAAAELLAIEPVVLR